MNPAAQTIRTRVASAGRLRRARETGRRLWQAAPLVAAICAGVAAGARWMNWPGLLSLGVVVAVLAALGAYVLSARRDRAISDRTAVELDGLAHLGGELRSATWFASRDDEAPSTEHRAQSTEHQAPSTEHPAPSADVWVEFHMLRAAERVQSTDWAALYPPVRAPRAKAATALFAIAALILALPVAGRAGVQALGSRAGGANAGAAAAADLALLPPELLKKLQDLLKEAERAGTPGTTTSLTADEFRDLLAKIDEAKDQNAAKDSKRGLDPSAKQMGLQGKELQDLAERLKRAATIESLTPEVRDAMSEVAEKLSEMSESQASSPKDPKDAAGGAEAPKGDAAQSNKSGTKPDASIQSVKDASAGGGVGVIMMSSEDPAGAQEAGLGLGGASGQRKNGGTMPDLMSALKKETIEAYKDDTGEKANMDVRRKTERGTATVAYSSTPPAAFEKGRATAPPAVPESRRAAVQTYFIRKP
jgi:hypothetical protein